MKVKRLAALNSAKAQKEILPFWHAEQPLCPHCGDECDISDNEWWHCYSEDDHEEECPNCGLSFTIRTHVQYSFSTDEQPDVDE